MLDTYIVASLNVYCAAVTLLARIANTANSARSGLLLHMSRLLQSKTPYFGRVTKVWDSSAVLPKCPSKSVNLSIRTQFSRTTLRTFTHVACGRSALVFGVTIRYVLPVSWMTYFFT